MLLKCLTQIFTHSLLTVLLYLPASHSYAAAAPDILVKGQVKSFNLKSVTLTTPSGVIKVPRPPKLKLLSGDYVSIYTNLKAIARLNNFTDPAL